MCVFFVCIVTVELRFLFFLLLWQKTDHKLSHQQVAVNEGQNPLPIYLAISLKDNYSAQDFKGNAGLIHGLVHGCISYMLTSLVLLFVMCFKMNLASFELLIHLILSFYLYTDFLPDSPLHMK